MNNGDPQPDDITGFRNELREVFGNLHWHITTVSPGFIHAVRSGMPDDFDRATATRRTEAGSGATYTVAFGHVQGHSLELKNAAAWARSYLSESVRSMQSVGWEAES